MTYLTEMLDRICRGFCPICSICEKDHYCKDSKEIAKIILRIMDNGEE